MGIVNATPDSFSGDGRPDRAAATAHAVALHRLSADIIDVGAESTRPGHQPIDAATESARLIPVIRDVRAALGDAAVISADTFKAEVFRAAFEAGADMLNSIWGMPDDLLDVAAACGVPVVITHNKAVAIYELDVVDEVVAFLEAAAQRALRAGLPAERILLDPGIGFGKLPEHNLTLLHSLPRIASLGFPTLLGTSRKSTIGKLIGDKPPAERVFGTAATVALAVAAGVDVVRVHDVAEIRDVVDVADAVVRGWRPPGWT
ncbi:MAG: dihydropteroate synthase [Candidatus Eremiobacteraeota bacterium]|nr:dihydropteroate synthase [Candidatus Eremiobacteraeota bacterium]